MKRYLSFDDFHRAVEKVRQHRLGWLLRKMLQVSEAERVQCAWATAASNARQWVSIPAVQARLNARATGRADQSIYAYVAERYLPSGGCRALSVACGSGANEVRWAQTGCFTRIDGYDLSAQRIEQARQRAQAAGLSDVLHFHISDIRNEPFGREAYDVVIAEGALHHISPLAPAVERLREALVVDGLFVVRDFVGPPRFQWTREQVAAADALLASIPERYRTRPVSGTVKRRVWTPGLWAMRWSDPSEAAESDRIPAVLASCLQPVEVRNLGGDLLHLAFDEIAHHFTRPDESRAEILSACFAREDAYLAVADRPGDFLFAIYRK